MELYRVRRTAKILAERIQTSSAKDCRTTPSRSDLPLRARIIAPMTRHKHTHTGLVTPQLPQLLLTAVLRLFAMLVSNVASTIRMRLRRPAVNATRQMPQPLPGMKTDTLKEQTAAQPRSPLISAHGEQRSSAARPSNRERAVRVADELVQWTNSSGERLSDSEGRVLTTVSYTHKPGSGPSGPRSPRRRGSSPLEQKIRNPFAAFWIPAFAGNTAERFRHSLT